MNVLDPNGLPRDMHVDAFGSLKTLLVDASGTPYAATGGGGGGVSNPAVVTGNITTITAAPTTVAGLVASSFITVAGGTTDSVTARANTIAGGPATATFGFFGTDDGVNLFPISGLPIGGAVGSGVFSQTGAAVGAWQLKGAAERAVYLVATALGGGTTLNASLSATPGTSRITAVLRGSMGGAVSNTVGSPTSEAITTQRADGADATQGAKADAAATTDTGTFSLIALFKRLLGKTPALGVAASAAAVPVVLASDDAQIGTKVTAVTALGAGGTGLIGWLSTIANFVKGLPTALGVATSASSMPVVLASDDAQVGAKITAVTALGAGGTGIIGWLSNIWNSLVSTLIVGGNVASGGADSGNPVKVGGKYNLAPPTLTDGQRGDAQLNANGAIRVELNNGTTTAAYSVTNADGISVLGTQRVIEVLSLAAVFNGTTFDRVAKANAASRLLTAAATTNSTNAKASTGNLFKITLNVAVAGKFLKLYNKATAPTVGTDTPVMTIPLPTTGFVQIDFGPTGLYFATGIGYALTGLIADADTTAVASGDVTGLNLVYA